MTVLAAAAAILDVIEQKLIDFLCKFECEYNLLVYLSYLSWCKCFATAAAAAASASNSYGYSENKPGTCLAYNIKLKDFTIGRFWLVGLVGQKVAVAISNSFHIVFRPTSAPMPNFIRIRWKTQKLETFTIFESQKCFWKIF